MSAKKTTKKRLQREGNLYKVHIAETGCTSALDVVDIVAESLPAALSKANHIRQTTWDGVATHITSIQLTSLGVWF